MKISLRTENKGCLVVFFSFFLAIGLAFTAFFVLNLIRSLGTLQWASTECVILESSVHTATGGNKASRFEPRISYRYDFSGQTFTSSRLSNVSADAGSCSKAQRISDKYPPGSKTDCFVNPQKPWEAILERHTPWTFVFVLIPLVFVAVGLGGIFFSLKKKSTSISGSGAKPLSSKPRMSSAGLILFLMIFAASGFCVMYFTFIRSAINIRKARKWKETLCRIISSKVAEHEGDDTATYSVDILYSYEAGGREYKSSRYSFMGGSSSGYGSKADAVRQYPEGSIRTCYVDPQDPYETVINRDFTSDMYIVGLVGLVFFLVGFVPIVVIVFRRAGESSAGVSLTGPQFARSPSALEWKSGVPCLQQTSFSETAELKPLASPGMKLFGIAAFALIWNRIIFAVFWGNRSPSTESFSWSDLASFIFNLPLLIFGGIGILLLVFTLYQLLAFFNPRPSVSLKPGFFIPGEETEIRWSFSGRVERISHLIISIEGREEATYQRGTNTVTDKKTFFQASLLEAQDFFAMRSGSKTFSFPENAMHSFEGSSNKIVWTLKIRGDISNWPDVNEEFKIIVLPLQQAGGSSNGIS